MPTSVVTLEASSILFDMDGVLVDSRAIVERAWRRWAVQHGLDVTAILAVAHGRRTRDTVAEVAPHLDAAREGHWLDATERQETIGLVAVPGAGELLATLPRDRWAVVTSADQALARERLGACGLPLPDLLISTDMVPRGKPDPDGYLLAAERLGFDAASCLVFEDSAPGIAAGRAAGMRVVGVATTQARDAIRGVEAVIDDQTDVVVRPGRSGLSITLRLGGR
ncbi:MAG: HAD-IA family hydrolase [Gemmatimonadaceae bacterium]